jgi:hypothetical protein
MEIDKLSEESLSALPARLETSDTNWASVGLQQGNVGVQLGAYSGQLAFQANAARITVAQINL